jgi:hypothetical protein
VLSRKQLGAHASANVCVASESKGSIPDSFPNSVDKLGSFAAMTSAFSPHATSVARNPYPYPPASVIVLGKCQTSVLSMGVLRNIYEQTVVVIGPNSLLAMYL